MSTGRKITRWLVRIMVVFTMIIVLVMVVTPRMINLEMVRNQIKYRMARDVGAEIKYRKLVLAYLPRPHIVIHSSEVQIPNSFIIKTHRMRVYPKILPLFKGSLKVASIRLEYADYFMELPQINATPLLPGEVVPIDAMIKAVASAVKGLPEFKLPDVRLFIKYGNVNLIDPFGHRFMLREVHADYHSSSDKLDFSIQCKSNLWDQIDINGFLDPSDFKGRSRIQLSRLRPQKLLAYLMPDSKLRVMDTRANLTIDFVSQGVDSLKADFDGAIPFLELRHDKTEVTFKGGRFKGTIGIGGKAVKVKLTDFRLDYPQLAATGMFSYDEDRDNIRMLINGSEINADAVRQMTLALAGESKIIRQIFDVIRGGHVPAMSFETRGHSMAEMGKLKNIVIKGKMTEGKIFIPGAELNLVNVFGDALISNGILNGDNLEARMGKTRGQKGTLRLGLNDAIAPLKLKIGINADLSQLPPVLNRVVANPDFTNELARITDVKGSARGVLILGDDLQSLRATVQVSEAELSARYDRIPFPINLAGGRFFYTGARIAIDKFDAAVGQSSVKQFSSVVNWEATPSLDFKAESASFNLAEIYSWLLTFEKYRDNLKLISSLDGQAATGELTIKGPFFHPQSWEFDSGGNLNKLKITWDHLPQALRIDQGNFSLNQAAFTLTDVDVSLGKSTFSQLSAHFKLKKRSDFDLQAQSANLMATDIYTWFAALKPLKPALEDFEVTAGRLVLHDLALSGPVHKPDQWHYQADGRMHNLVVASDAFTNPLSVNQGGFELTTAAGLTAGVPGKKIKLDVVQLTWDNSRLVVNGNLTFHASDVLVDSILSADTIDWSQIDRLINFIKQRNAKADRFTRAGNVIGTLNVTTDKLLYDSYTVQPLQAQIAFKPQAITINIEQASVCSIDIRGLVDVYQDTLEIYLVPTAVDQNLATAAACLSGQKEMATGAYNLNGEVLSKGQPEAFGRLFSGDLAFSAQNGRIYRFGLLAKILSILNVTEIYRGEVPDLTGQGFAYRSMTAKAAFKGDKLIMQECSLDGVSMGIACEGDIDLMKKEMDLVVLVAPFKTVDRIVDIIPVIGHVLGGKLISIPFRAKGALQDPDVIPLSPKAVGTDMLGILERTLKLPITIIQPMLPGPETKREEDQTP
jgi:hypothetical protein